MERSVCWNITCKCNEDCKFCFRFTDESVLSFEENKKILDNLIKLKVKKITWTGGECLLYPHLFDLMKLAHEAGIENILISNAVLLDKKKISEISSFVDYMTFSIDSTDSRVNEKMGRGSNHFKHIKELMDFIKDETNIRLRINSLVSKMNHTGFGRLARLIDKYNVERWKLFKFAPLRGRAIEANSLFEITDKQYLEATSTAQKNAPNTRVVVCINTNLEEDYLLINPIGDFLVTKDQKDEKICNYKNIDLGKLEEILKS